MLTNTKHLHIILVLFSMIFSLTACSNSGSNTPIPPGLHLETSNTRLYVGEGTKIRALYYEGNNYQDITDLVSCTSGSEDIDLTPENYAVGLSPGSGEVNCDYEGDQRSLSLTVLDMWPENSILGANDTSIHVGAIGYFRLRGYYSDGRQVEYTPYAKWESQDEAIATVSQGEVTAISTTGERTRIIASHAGLPAEDIVMQVIPGAPSRIEIVQDQPFYIGVSRYFRAIGYWDDGDEGPLGSFPTWSVSNDRVEPYYDNYATYLAVAEGPFTISATYLGVTGTLDTRVTPAIVVGVNTAPLIRENILVGESLDIVAYATYSDGTVVDISGVADWHQSVGEPAVVFNTNPESNEASATGIRPAGFSIWADYDGVTGWLQYQFLRVDEDRN